MLRSIRFIHRTRLAAASITRRLRYAVLSGRVAADLASGLVVRTGDFLDRLGAHDLPDGQRSWYGRHVAKAYRAATAAKPLMVWAQHRTTGKWIHVNVYSPIDSALFAGLSSYKATRHLVAADFVEAA